MWRVTELKIALDPLLFTPVIIRYIYWMLVALYVVANYGKLDLLVVSKYFLLGTICLLFCFFFFDKNYTFFLIKLMLDSPRNYMVYTLIISIPFSLYYIHHYFKKKGVLMGSIFFMLIIFLTDGRAGTIIVAIQLLLILGIVYPNVKRLSIFVVAWGTILLGLFPINIDKSVERFGRNMSDVSPRISNLILEQGDGDLSMDKSWLIRELMVTKGLEITGKYTLFGIGPNNFKNYRAEISSYYEIQRLSGHSKSFYNELSAHNSYIKVLAEFGLLGFCLFVLIIASINLFWIKNIFSSKITMNFVPIISVFGASIQFYVISSISGAISWFIIAVAWMMYKTKNINFNKTA